MTADVDDDDVVLTDTSICLDADRFEDLFRTPERPPSRHRKRSVHFTDPM